MGRLVPRKGEKIEESDSAIAMGLFLEENEKFSTKEACLRAHMPGLPHQCFVFMRHILVNNCVQLVMTEMRCLMTFCAKFERLSMYLALINGTFFYKVDKLNINNLLSA